MATTFETKQGELLERQAFESLQTEYPKHFDALRMHPRNLVGKEVPSTKGPGMEVLRDSADAADWQAAMKQILIDEVASRVETQKDTLRDVFSTVHSSISLFQNNTDLIPGTKQFDRELADAFVAAAKDYELKTNGKLIGYSVPVQPIVNAIRAQLAAQRAAKAAAPAPASAPTAQQQRAAEQARTPQGQFDGPQAGIRSQAGASAEPGSDEAAGVLGAFLRQNGVTL